MDNCIFCKIISGEIPSKKVYEDDLIYGFNDVNPVAPVHILLIPKKHISTLNDMTDEDIKIITHIYSVAKRIAKEVGISKEGYRIVTNCGENAGQTVFHVHFHLIGGKKLQWP